MFKAFNPNFCSEFMMLLRHFMVAVGCFVLTRSVKACTDKFTRIREKSLIEECFGPEVMGAISALKLLCVVLLSVLATGCYGEAPPTEERPEDVPSANVRVANFHKAFSVMCVQAHDGVCQDVGSGEIISLKVSDVGQIIMFGDNAEYKLSVSLLLGGDIVVVREKNGGSRVTADVVNKTNKEEYCDMYAGFNEPAFYSKLCPSITEETKEVPSE
jgi:hypothetical protein